MKIPYQKAWAQVEAIPVAELTQEKFDQIFEQAESEVFLEELGVAQAEGRDLMEETRQRLFPQAEKPDQ